MAQINLAPGSQYLVLVRHRRRLLYATSALIALVVVAAGIILAVMVNSADRSVQAVEQELQNVETHIAQASVEVKRIQLFEARLTSIGGLLEKHRTWSPYLQEIERLLPPEIVLTKIQGNYDNRTIELIGSAPTIDSAAQALASLQNQSTAHATLFTAGTITNVDSVAQTSPTGEVLGQRYAFTINLAF